jgi:hypothetical protein
VDADSACRRSSIPACVARCAWLCRYVLKQVRRKNTQTSFAAMLYWTGDGDELSESKKEQWQQWLKDSLQLMKEVLPEPSTRK